MRATWLLAKAAHPLLKAVRGRSSPPPRSLRTSRHRRLGLFEQQGGIGHADSTNGMRLGTGRHPCQHRISPGSTRTNISKNAGLEVNPGPRVANNPLGFIGEPEDQSAVIAFLAGPDARYITGADIVVDGGARTQLMVSAGLGDPLNRRTVLRRHAGDGYPTEYTLSSWRHGKLQSSPELSSPEFQPKPQDRAKPRATRCRY